jgi:hypothetical protein
MAVIADPCCPYNGTSLPKPSPPQPNNCGIWSSGWTYGPSFDHGAAPVMSCLYENDGEPDWTPNSTSD